MRTRLSLFMTLVLTLILSACNMPVPSTGSSTPYAPATPAPTGKPVGTPDAQNPTAQPGGPKGEEFDQQLAQAITRRDFAFLRSAMREPFVIIGWRTDALNKSTPDQAIQELEQNTLAEGAQPKAQFDKDVTRLIEGNDPLAFFKNFGSPVRGFSLTGLGKERQDEAIAIVGRDPNSGERYWLGMLVAYGGFPRTGGSGSVIETPVKHVTALDVLNVRSGPGTSYAVIGQVREGEAATVTGASPDKGWWQIECTQDTSGRCWISADPSLTKPEQ